MRGLSTISSLFGMDVFSFKDFLNLLLSIALYTKCNLGGSAHERYRPYLLIHMNYLSL